MEIYLKNNNQEWELMKGKQLQDQLNKNHIRLGDDVELGKYVELGNDVKIGDDVELGKYVKIGDDVKIGNNVELGNLVELGNGVRLGDNIELGNLVELGNGVRLGDDVELGNGVKLGNYVGLGNGVKIEDDVELMDSVKLDKHYTIQDIIAGSLGQYPFKNKYIFYKRVNKISRGKYTSYYNPNFTYADNKITKAKNPESLDKSRADDIYVSTPFYWHKGNTLIACEVKLKDVITCKNGKIKCIKIKVLGEIKQ